MPSLFLRERHAITAAYLLGYVSIRAGCPIADA
jgi:hypothetical protein